METLLNSLKKLTETLETCQTPTQQDKNDAVAKLRPFLPKSAVQELHTLAREAGLNVAPYMVRNYLCGLTSDKHGLFEVLVDYAQQHIEQTEKYITVIKDLEDQFVTLQTAKNELSRKLSEMKNTGMLNDANHKMLMSYVA